MLLEQALLEVVRMRVLDLGCGEGRDLLTWNVAPSDEVTGVDIDGARITAAREHFPGRTYRQPFAAASFDRVISNISVPYMDIAKAFTEAHRVLLPGGRLSISVHRWNFTMTELRNCFPKPIPTLFRLYVIANGIIFHCTGRTVRSFNGRTESFQTERGLRIALCRAGFENIAFSEWGDGRFVVEACKRKYAQVSGLATAA